jgi:hypothetical protein
MNKRALLFKHFSICVAEGWDDITASLDDPDAPSTIADPISGVGALQFSPAVYKSGRLPQICPRDLSELLHEFASKKGLDDPFDRSTYSGEVSIEGASYRSKGEFIRIWYASDGKNVMLVTYVCEWNSRNQEASESEGTVRSIRFCG